MDREDIIYNKYREIMDVYEPLKWKGLELEKKVEEVSEQIKLMESELAIKIKEADEEDKSRNDVFKKKNEKFVDNILFSIIIITWLVFVASIIMKQIASNNTGVIGLIVFGLIKIILSFIPAFLVGVVSYPIILLFNNLTYKNFLRVKYKKVNRSTIKELESNLKKEKDNLKAIEDELSKQRNELFESINNFTDFLRNVSYM